MDYTFIILRYLSNDKSNLYWNTCYDCIRKYYKTEHIYIIDDHSKILAKRIGDELINTTIINSELPPSRGELLPYYYFYTRKFSKNTVILHDTVFIQKKIDPKFLNTKTYHFLWHANHKWDNNEEIINCLDKMTNNNKLIKLYKKKIKWDVCFGGMSIININYLKSIFDNTNYFKILINEINSREKRMNFERIIGLLLSTKIKTESINGDINKFLPRGTKATNLYSYNNYLNNPSNFPMVKIVVGRDNSVEFKDKKIIKNTINYLHYILYLLILILFTSYLIYKELNKK